MRCRLCPIQSPANDDAGSVDAGLATSRSMTTAMSGRPTRRAALPVRSNKLHAAVGLAAELQGQAHDRGRRPARAPGGRRLQRHAAPSRGTKSHGAIFFFLLFATRSVAYDARSHGGVGASVRPL